MEFTEEQENVLYTWILWYPNFKDSTGKWKGVTEQDLYYTMESDQHEYSKYKYKDCILAKYEYKGDHHYYYDNEPISKIKLKDFLGIW